jgi:hypothetical protein
MPQLLSLELVSNGDKYNIIACSNRLSYMKGTTGRTRKSPDHEAALLRLRHTSLRNQMFRYCLGHPFFVVSVAYLKPRKSFPHEIAVSRDIKFKGMRIPTISHNIPQYPPKQMFEQENDET